MQRSSGCRRSPSRMANEPDYARLYLPCVVHILRSGAWPTKNMEIEYAQARRCDRNRLPVVLCRCHAERRWLRMQGHARNLVRQELLRMFCQSCRAGRLLLLLVEEAQAACRMTDDAAQTTNQKETLEAVRPRAHSDSLCRLSFVIRRPFSVLRPLPVAATRYPGRKAKMKSYRVTAFGAPLEPIEAPTPKPSGTGVLLRVKAAGVCHSDLHIWEGGYDLGHGKRISLKDRGIPLPLTMGHETV